MKISFSFNEFNVYNTFILSSNDQFINNLVNNSNFLNFIFELLFSKELILKKQDFLLSRLFQHLIHATSGSFLFKFSNPPTLFDQFLILSENIPFSNFLLFLTDNSDYFTLKFLIS